MKRIVIVAGFLGAVGVVTAAPASAQPETDVSCAPAFLCQINSVPQQTVTSLASLPNDFSEGIASLPSDAAESFARLGDAPGRIASLPNDFATSIANLPGDFISSIASLPSDAAESLARPFGPVESSDDE